MESENKNNLANEIVKGQIEKILATIPENENKKTYLTKSLTKMYGKDLTNQIISGLPKDFFGPEKEDKKYNFSSKGKILLATILGIAGTAYFATNTEETNTGKAKNQTEIPISEETTEKKQEYINPKFNKEIYESLPEQGKEIYKIFSQNDITPDRNYIILDKENAQQYGFNAKNALVSKIVPGFGRDEGDAPNSSVRLGYNTGKMTTPAGVYLISSATDPADIQEYGKLQISLFGISILGNTEFLGEHQTYTGHGEYEPRTKKLQSVSVEDNKFSNGCINIDAKDFEQFISPHFKQDYGELFFVLPDSTSLKSGVKYDVKKMIESIMPMMIEMANRQEVLILETLEKCSIEEKIQKKKTLLLIKKKREAAEKILLNGIL